MAEYYFISQLPSLDGISENTPLPITEERFTELCERFLGQRFRNTMNKLTLSPSKKVESFKKSGSGIVSLNIHITASIFLIAGDFYRIFI